MRASLFRDEDRILRADLACRGVAAPQEADDAVVKVLLPRKARRSLERQALAEPQRPNAWCARAALAWEGAARNRTHRSCARQPERGRGARSPRQRSAGPWRPRAGGPAPAAPPASRSTCTDWCAAREGGRGALGGTGGRDRTAAFRRGRGGPSVPWLSIRSAYPHVCLRCSSSTARARRWRRGGSRASCASRRLVLRTSAGAR